MNKVTLTNGEREIKVSEDQVTAWNNAGYEVKSDKIELKPVKKKPQNKEKD